MFRVRHGRVTSLASGMLRMSLPCLLERPHSMRPSPPNQGRHQHYQLTRFARQVSEQLTEFNANRWQRWCRDARLRVTSEGETRTCRRYLLVRLHPLRLERISYSEAAQFFNQYEHLGNCGLGVWHWGAFQDGRLIAVVSFGTTCFARTRGRLASIATTFGLGLYQISRGGTASNAPSNTPSRVVSAALGQLHCERGDCLVIAYADRNYNEVGTIYQACNGCYIGQTSPKDQSNYVIDGRIMSGWVVRKKFGTRDIEKLKKMAQNVVKLPLTQKYRYVFVQAKRSTRTKVLQALQPLVLPYPNRHTENIASMDIKELIGGRGGVNSATESIIAQ